MAMEIRGQLDPGLSVGCVSVIIMTCPAFINLPVVTLSAAAGMASAHIPMLLDRSTLC